MSSKAREYEEDQLILRVPDSLSDQFHNAAKGASKLGKMTLVFDDEDPLTRAAHLTLDDKIFRATL